MTKLRYLRTAKGLTQKQVGDKIGKTMACICQYETGVRQIPIASAKKLAKTLGCEWEDFYRDDSKETG